MTKLKWIKSIHPAFGLRSRKTKSNSQLSFLDVLVNPTSTLFLTSVYRKSTFDGLYMRWDSFCSENRKINVIKTLTHSAVFFDNEINCVTKIQYINAYPPNIVHS